MICDLCQLGIPDSILLSIIVHKYKMMMLNVLVKRGADVRRETDFKQLAVHATVNHRTLQAILMFFSILKIRKL